MKKWHQIILPVATALFFQGCLAGNKPEPFTVQKNNNVDLDKVFLKISKEVNNFNPETKCLVSKYTNTSPTSGISLNYIYNMCLEVDNNKIDSIYSCITTQTNPGRITTVFNPVTMEHSIEFKRNDNSIERISLKELALLEKRVYKKGETYRFATCDYSEGVMGIGKLDGSKEFKDKVSKVKTILEESVK